MWPPGTEYVVRDSYVGVDERFIALSGSAGVL